MGFITTRPGISFLINSKESAEKNVEAIKMTANDLNEISVSPVDFLKYILNCFSKDKKR